MPEPMVAVEGLSKRYLLGQLHTNLLSERLTQLFRPRQRAMKELWALRNVGFEVQQGDVLGVIGRNGAGKSTLLKILSRITAPTRGRAVVRGRLSSLLEVGTGFHPELTGRENIYLNGTILGMRKREIDAKFDDIVAFSEVEKFLDTPVKRYSSGMYVRLAFGVAAHLDPDVLVVDEVLAVGDREFQEKCLGRMRSIAESEGRTVLFVSHNLDAMARICTHGLYLRNGEVEFGGSIGAAIDRYINSSRSAADANALGSRVEREGSGAIVAVGMDVYDERGATPSALESGGNYRFRVRLERRDPSFRANDVNLAIELRDPRDIPVWLIFSAFSGAGFTVDRSEVTVEASVRDLALAAGDYSVTLFVSHGTRDVLDLVHNARIITVAGGDFFGTGSSGLPESCRTLTRADWKVLDATP
ncbi:MAG TPA: ABC transporter ATP-binding protein [Thermoanaerobaculia bacterium]|jgi:lipopolysaccharide transport system ATP-binding protein